MKLTAKQILFFSCIFALFFLSLIPAARLLLDKPLLPGDAPYYDIRMANYIKENGIPVKDPLIDRPYILQPYHLILAFFSNFFNIYILSALMPLFCGLLSVIIFYFILKELKLELLNIQLILFVLILSPSFIYLFSASCQHAITILLMLLGFYFFIKNKGYFIPSLVIFAAMPFFGILPSLISICLLFVYSLNDKSKLGYFYMTLFSIMAILLVYHLPFLYYYGLPQRTKFISSNAIANLVSDFGGNFGFGAFNLILAILGIYIAWMTKKQITGYLFLLLLLVFSIYFSQIYLYLIFIAAVLAGVGFNAIIRMKWKIPLIKRLTIILIICGLLFSTLSYINRTANSLPDTKTFESLEWLRENSDTQSVVFSYYTKGNWIEAIGERAAILDSQIAYISLLDERFNDSSNIFYSRSLKKTRPLLDKYGIRYIWIDYDMRHGEVWTKEEEGLLFLFRNSEMFSRVYSNDKTEIWAVVEENNENS